MPHIDFILESNTSTDGQPVKHSPGQPFTNYQLQQLRKCFEENEHITGKDKKLLAKRVKLEPTTITEWFLWQRKRKYQQLHAKQQISIKRSVYMQKSGKQCVNLS